MKGEDILSFSLLLLVFNILSISVLYQVLIWLSLILPQHQPVPDLELMYVGVLVVKPENPR